MAACQFSETQFEAYHSRQLEQLLGSSLPQYFPTRNEEGNIGVDMVHFTNYHSLFFQYKVPSSISSTNLKCHGLAGNCYRMKIYHRTDRASQYQLLWDWAETEQHVYYATPEFNTDHDFSINYRNILQHTAHFRLRGNFIDPSSAGFDSHQHFIYYSDRSNNANMYSEEYAEVKKIDIKDLISSLKDSKPKREEFGIYIKKQNEKLLSILRQRNPSDARFENQQVGLDLLLADEDKKGWDDYYLMKYRLRKYFNLDWLILRNKEQ